MNFLARTSLMPNVPAIMASAGERASYRFFEFFTANLRNPHTRRAYAPPPSNSSIGWRREE